MRFILILAGAVLFDLWLLLEMGRRLGIGPLVVLMLITGLLGVSLLKTQGLSFFYQSRWELIRGRMPARTLINGVVFLVGASLLIAPGPMADVAGLILIFPSTRQAVIGLVDRWLRHRYRRHNFLKLFGKGRGDLGDG